MLIAYQAILTCLKCLGKNRGPGGLLRRDQALVDQRETEQAHETDNQEEPVRNDVAEIRDMEDGAAVGEVMVAHALMQRRCPDQETHD